jgi:hypothetical protein
MMAEACHELFGRLEKLEVADWAYLSAHFHVDDYPLAESSFISRRKDRCSVAETIFPLCKHLKLLAIRQGASIQFQ